MKKTKEYTINGNAPPKDVVGYVIHEHRECGVIVWDPLKVELYLDEHQCNNQKVIAGHELYKKLENKSILNANVLDYLLENQHLIPKDWKKGKDKQPLQIFFWGTIYCPRGYPGATNFQVRYLTWSKHDKKWICVYTHLDFQLFQESPAAIITTN